MAACVKHYFTLDNLAAFIKRSRFLLKNKFIFTRVRHQKSGIVSPLGLKHFKQYPAQLTTCLS